jgi:hypothetical protein
LAPEGVVHGGIGKQRPHRGYPSTAIKQHLAGKSGASKTQIQNWLQNARRRLRKSEDRSLPLTRPLALRAKGGGLSLFPPAMLESCVRRGSDERGGGAPAGLGPKLRRGWAETGLGQRRRPGRLQWALRWRGRAQVPCSFTLSSPGPLGALALRHSTFADRYI